MKITKPTLLVNEQKVKANIQQMAEKARRNGATLRPHFKTHQSADVGQWFVGAGVNKATVSSVDMARYFADAGWQDITIAFPYNPLEAGEVAALANRVNLNVIIVSKKALEHLNAHVDAPISYFIKVDVGTHRTGVNPDDPEEIKAIGKTENPQHQFVGLLAHAGHSYKPLTKADAQVIFNESMQAFDQVKAALQRDDLIISYGDTPICSLLDEFSGIDELRPGNFAFYDIMQHHFGSCDLEQIAVCLASPVVAIHAERNEIVVYGGAVHLSKDFIEVEGEKVFGYVVRLSEAGWGPTPVATISRLSQEHGIIKANKEMIDYLQIGDLVGILPVHSCLTADLQGYYVSLDGSRLNKLDKARI